MEVFYLTNAISFFVGWAWICFLRDLQTLVARLGESSDLWSYAGEALCVFLFGPGLTWLLVRGHYWCGARAAGRHVWQALLARVGIDEPGTPLAEAAVQPAAGPRN